MLTIVTSDRILARYLPSSDSVTTCAAMSSAVTNSIDGTSNVRPSFMIMRIGPPLAASINVLRSAYFTFW